MKNYEKIHETVLRDALDIMDTIIGVSNGELEEMIAKHKNRRSIRSIARASNDLICVFPVMASRSIAIENQAMNTKAIEKNCVSMLQILFSAIQLSDASDAFEYIQNFHTNINKSAKLFDIDDVIGISDSMTESSLIQEGYRPDANVLQALREDMKNLHYTLEPDLNPRSLSESFTCKLGPNGKYAVEVKPMSLMTESKNGKEIGRLKKELADQIAKNDQERANLLELINSRQTIIDGLRVQNTNISSDLAAQIASNSSLKNQITTLGTTNNTAKAEINRLEKEQKSAEAKLRTLEDSNSKLKKELDAATNADKELEAEVKRSTIRKNDFANKQALSAVSKNNVEMLSKQVLNTEYKKANEMMPTLMIVNFKSKTDDGYETVDSVIIGVKAKLYPIESEDIVTHVVSKTTDSNWVQKLIKASTREISFFRDFLFAIDKAKIDALSMSRRGSSNKMWKVLERRAFKSRFNRLMARKNDATAITTLMVSQNEVDYIKKQFQIDLGEVNIARNLLEKYNLLGICIVDESLEISKFMWDTGEDMWETIAFSHLERESNDNTYKKVVNLMTRIA